MNNLRNVLVGSTAKVVKIHGEGAVKRRIMDMGITKGVEIYVRKVAPLGALPGVTGTTIGHPIKLLPDIVPIIAIV